MYNLAAEFMRDRDHIAQRCSCVADCMNSLTDITATIASNCPGATEDDTDKFARCAPCNL